MAEQAERQVIVGRIVGLYGVKGWVKVRSYTDPPTNILEYSPWQVHTAEGCESLELSDGRAHGAGIVARLGNCADRDQAARLLGADIAVDRDQFGPAETGEYFWVDLVGLRVVNREGVELGTVDRLFETGANDVLVVRGERERLIPFVMDQVVIEVDLQRRILTVDWDPEF